MHVDHGGYVYHGSAVPEHDGRYFFADYGLGWIRSVRVEGERIVEHIDWAGAPGFGIQLLGVDGADELYVLQSNGAIRRIGAER